MKLKIKNLFLICLIFVTIALNSCVGKSNQIVNPTSLPTLATFTPVPPTSISIITQTVTPTDWFTALLTTTPTMMYTLPILPPDCGLINFGKAGTQAIDNTQNILVQGKAILCSQHYDSMMGMITATILEGLIDLDTGAFNIEEADFWFCPDGGSTIFYYLCDFNNSEVKKYQFIFENGKVLEPKQPSFEECSGTEPYADINDNEAKYACVITTLGNISRVKVERFDPIDNVISVEISFVTWKK